MFYIHGHRGCRGLLPENTIPAFLKAVELGVTAIELDVVITVDEQVLVSHEPWMNHQICLDKNGNTIAQAHEMEHNIYRMMYDEVKQYNCGTKPHPGFIHQQNIAAHKPLLADVIDSVENFCAQNKLPAIHYNIEIKSLPQGDNMYHPVPEKFCALVVGVLQLKQIKHFNLQSFDMRILKHLHLMYPHIKLAGLNENDMPVQQFLDMLDFIPQTYSPHHTLVNAQMLLFCKKKDIKVIPWTVNNLAHMRQLISLGVDGIITDYPDVLISLIKKEN